MSRGERLMPAVRSFGVAAFLGVLVSLAWMPLAGAPPQAAAVSPDTPAFQEFKRLVQAYVNLQKGLPRLRTTKNSKEIVQRRLALAQKIRETRANAKAGDLFTPEISAEFRKIIQTTLRGPHAPDVRKTIRQGEPLPSWRLEVNGAYPEHLPVTTVPPTLLLQLPQLPSEVAYRIIGHALVLQDTEARVIVDFIPTVFP